MAIFNPGDLVTFPLRDGKYGVAQLVHIDDLALNDLYHFTIRDAVVDGDDLEAIDEFGRQFEREHDPAPVESAPLLIEHVGLTRHGLDASDLAFVAWRELDEDDLVGYRAWLKLRYEDALRRGTIRERIDDNVEEQESELDEVDAELDEESDSSREQPEGAAPATEPAGETEEAAAASSGDAADDDVITAMTLGVYDVALGDALVRQRSVFEREAYSDSALGRFIIGLADDTARIVETIERLLDGDFSAGDELMEYGDVGMRALGEALARVTDPQTAEDVLQVLVNSGESVAYERVAAFMATHGLDPADALYASAVRAYCYAVMLTAGEPESLRQRLAMLENVRSPELAEDVRAAREALATE